MSMKRSFDKYSDRKSLLKKYDLALERAEILSGTVGYSGALAELGSIEMKLGEYDKAAESFEAAARAARGWLTTKEGVAELYEDFSRFAREKAVDEGNSSLKNNFSEEGFSFVVALSGFVLSLLFLAPHFTGFVVSYSYEGVLDFLGVLSFVVGIIASFVFVRKKRNFFKSSH